MGELLERIRDRTAEVVVLGQGYVGLTVAMRASEAGFPVVGLEADDDRTHMLRRGQSYIEDIPGDTLEAALARGYRPTSDPADLGGFDVAVISVPTPLREGLPDLSYIESATRALGQQLRPGCLVILESTTYPGTTEELVGPLLEETSPGDLRMGRDFLLGYSPERIDPGNQDFDLANTPKVVAGIDEASLDAVTAFYETFVAKTVPVSSPGVAELVKVLENTFRHVNVALVNEIAMFAHDLGIDAFEAIQAASTKPFGFMPFRPGPGVGGHCLPIDPTYLSWQVKRRLGENFRFVELANDINQHMPAYVLRRINHLLNRDRKAVRGSRIVVLGMAYKPDVGDARETPSVPIIQGLTEMGAQTVAVDPHTRPIDVDLDDVPLRRELDRDLLAWADLVVLVTDHDAFDYDLVVRASRRILDTRNRLRGYEGDHIDRL